MSGAITRRQMIRRLLWVAAAVVSGQAFSERAAAVVGRPAVRGLVELLPHGRSAALIGARFLATHPQEADLDTLVVRLGLSADALPPPLSPQLMAAARAIEALHIDDFRNDRLIEIEGWSLSVTELRLAAVVHLASSVA